MLPPHNSQPCFLFGTCRSFLAFGVALVVALRIWRNLASILVSLRALPSPSLPQWEEEGVLCFRWLSLVKCWILVAELNLLLVMKLSVKICYRHYSHSNPCWFPCVCVLQTLQFLTLWSVNQVLGLLQKKHKHRRLLMCGWDVTKMVGFQ